MLELDRIVVGYPAAAGPRVVVNGLSLTLAAGAIGCLLGASGCGKTTVLRAIAGFEPLRAGRIALAGQVLAEERASARVALPPERRRVGMMFQDYALFPHLDVAGNVGFGLRGATRDARTRRIADMLALVGLASQARAYPHELSGGQQQRVALARALAPAPALLLLDEPFSSLDADNRQRLAGELRVLLQATATTVLMVTHDQSEAFALADGIGVMHEGRILQWADAQTLYRRPSDRLVAGFVGRGSWVRGTTLGLADGIDVRLRPEDLVVEEGGPIHAVLETRVFRGPQHAGWLRFASGETAEITLPDGDAAHPGASLALRIASGDLLVFPR